MLQTFHIGRHGRNCLTTVSANYEQMHNDQQTIQYTKIKKLLVMAKIIYLFM